MKNGMIFKITLLLIFSLFLITSCAPKNITPKKIPDLKYEKTATYNIIDELNKLPKPDKIKPIYVILDGNQIIKSTKEEATYILLAPKEYSKVGAVVDLAVSYKKIVKEQEVLVNTYIKQINALKTLLELERQKVQHYQELYINAENAYRQEKYDHKFDNILNRAGMYMVTIGSVVLVALAI